MAERLALETTCKAAQTCRWVTHKAAESKREIIVSMSFLQRLFDRPSVRSKCARQDVQPRAVMAAISYKCPQACVHVPPDLVVKDRSRHEGLCGKDLLRKIVLAGKRPSHWFSFFRIPVVGWPLSR